MSRPDFGLAEALGLAAAPTFAVMALLTGLPAATTAPMLCGHVSAFGGMAPMYVLMAAFHAGPWLRLARRTPMP